VNEKGDRHGYDFPGKTSARTENDNFNDASVRVFRGPNQIGIEPVMIPKAGPGEAVIRVTLTTICGTDLHILKGEYPGKADGRGESSKTPPSARDA
jgi:hypothetical protein